MLAQTLMIAAAVAGATPAQLPPVDRCRDDWNFSQFRLALGDAVTRKDPAALRRLTADNVLSSFGGGGSWDEFASTWALNQPQKSGLWRKMQDVIALGCAVTDDGGRVFPGMLEDIGDDADPFELLVVRPGAPLHAAPDKNASWTTTLPWASVTVIEAPGPDGWVKVQAAGEDPAWVETGFVISPLDYRLVSEFRDGRWRITAFIAGD